MRAMDEQSPYRAPEARLSSPKSSRRSVRFLAMIFVVWGVLGLYSRLEELGSILTQQFSGIYGPLEHWIFQVAGVATAIEYISVAGLGVAMLCRSKTVKIFVATAVVSIVISTAWKHLVSWPKLAELYGVDPGSPWSLGFDVFIVAVLLAVYRHYDAIAKSAV